MKKYYKTVKNSLTCVFFSFNIWGEVEINFEKGVLKMDRILSRKEAARFLTISLSTLDILIRERAVPFRHIGAKKSKRPRVLFSREQLSEWIATHTGDLDDPEVLKELGLLIQEDWRDTKELSKVGEQFQAVIKNLRVICQEEIDEGIEESEPLKGEEGDILKKMHEEVVTLSDKIKEIEKRMVERAKERFGLEKELKKPEVKKRPYKIFEPSLSVDPRLPKR